MKLKLKRELESAKKKKKSEQKEEDWGKTRGNCREEEQRGRREMRMRATRLRGEEWRRGQREIRQL